MSQPGRQSQWLTLANGISLLRFPGAGLSVFLVITNGWPAALAVFIAAVVSDLVDGPLARSRGTVSSLGGKLDHGADATFVTATLGALAAQAYVPPLLPILVALAFFQYALDSGRTLRPSPVGRWNGIAYFVLCGIPIVQNGLGIELIARFWIGLLGWFLVVSTVFSMADRMIRRFRS